MNDCDWLLPENGCKVKYEHICPYSSVEERSRCYWFDEVKR